MNCTYRLSPFFRISLLIAFLFLGGALTKKAQAQNVADWSYIFNVTVSNPGSALEDYQVKVVLDGNNFDFTKAKPDGSDLLFSDLDNTVFYPYWIENWDSNTEHGVIWVRLPYISGGETTIINMLTGNPNAAPRSNGNETFIFYSGFEELDSLSGMNAPEPLMTPTYDGSGQAVHPDVVHVPDGWNGYDYWMVMTPYPNSSDFYENLSILASNDNQNWIVPPGVTNPLAPTPNGHNDDPDMLLVDGEMIIYYNETNDDGNTYLNRLASIDGINWGTPQTVITLPNYIMSPSVIYEDSVYTMWYVRSPAGCTSSYQDFFLRKSTDGFNWGPEQPANLELSERILWHVDVQKMDSLYTMLFISYPEGSTCSHSQLYYAESADGIEWTANQYPLLVPSIMGWDNYNVYRGSFILNGAYLRIWYSGRSERGQWHIGYTEGEFDDFVTEPIETWTDINGNVLGTTDHPRTGTHSLRGIGGSIYPQVLAPIASGDVCINVWYWEEMITTDDFMAILRLRDSDNSAHCIGTGINTGESTENYIWHDEGFDYSVTPIQRMSGWHHLSIAVGTSIAELRIDGTPVATTAALTPGLIDCFSVEGYREGTAYFDDAYVRSYSEPEPEVTINDSSLVSDTSGHSISPNIILHQNIPNPFNASTVIPFSLTSRAYVKLVIYDVTGNKVRVLVDGVKETGDYNARWNGRDDSGKEVASGIYFCRYTTGNFTQTKKMVLLK